MLCYAIPDHIINQYVNYYGPNRYEGIKLFSALCFFLDLCALTGLRKSPSYTVQATWQHFVSFPREYEEFCKRRYGFKFYPKNQLDHAAYQAARATYVKKYGEPDPCIWPRLAAKPKSSNKGRQLNAA